jgi:hypothetical protein
MPTGPKTALLKGFFKEVLRTLKDDSAYLAQADQLQSASAARGAAAAAAWSVQPDAHRAFARLQQLVVSGDPRAVWAAGKERAKERLREACAAMGRRLEEAGAPAGQQEQQRMEARSAHGVDGGAVVAAAEVDEQQLKHLYGTDGWARVRLTGGGWGLWACAAAGGWFCCFAAGPCAGPHSGTGCSVVASGGTVTCNARQRVLHASACAPWRLLSLPPIHDRRASCTPWPTLVAHG